MIETDIEPELVESQSDSFHGVLDKRRIIIDMEARKRLEEKLEQRRLEKLIRDYDFDLERDLD
ncbi:MAG: PA3496 family putative envelope integrity protein [Gammaproteobacteria bacterium]|jgi:hypothetical protein